MNKKTLLSFLAPALLLLQVNAASAAVCGDAYYNHEIDWPSTSALYYSVSGAPANTCGTLMASRNGGAYTSGANWICTDANGNATKGPWSSNPDDETAYVYIDWGTCTSPVRKHIWDVDPPSATVSAVMTSFYGTARDDNWGAGFNASWSSCLVTFQDHTSGLYWSDNTGAYSAASADFIPCTIFGMPSLNVSWSANNIPDLPDHTSGHAYWWTVWIYDGGQWDSTLGTFTYP